MASRGAGCIVTVASNAAGVPRAEMAAYAASKAAAAHFTRCLGLELAPRGIRCNIVAPGSTDTTMLRSMWSEGQGAQSTIDGSPRHFKVGIPLQKLAQPEEVAEAVLFLASERASHITMQDLYVDGGAALRA
jgi:2,3-dihydro-2,3-dihydroxybenzoate dehydrogenase